MPGRGRADRKAQQESEEAHQLQVILSPTVAAFASRPSRGGAPRDRPRRARALRPLMLAVRRSCRVAGVRARAKARGARSSWTVVERQRAVAAGYQQHRLSDSRSLFGKTAAHGVRSYVLRDDHLEPQLKARLTKTTLCVFDERFRAIR